MTLPPTASPTVTRAPDAGQRTGTLLDATRFHAVPRTSPASGTTASWTACSTSTRRGFDAAAVRRRRRRAEGDELRALARADAAGDDKRARPGDTSTSDEVGAPSLRTAGLMLVQSAARGDAEEPLHASRRTATTRPRASRSAAAPPPRRSLRRGHWSAATASTSGTTTTRQLAFAVPARRALRSRTTAQVIVVDVPRGRRHRAAGGDEVVRPDEQSRSALLHEALVSWTGWSLAARRCRAGRSDHRDDSVGQDEAAEPEAEVPPGLARDSVHAVPGSLPRLRYGRTYWIRARVVDLAGNSLAPNAEGLRPRAAVDERAHVPALRAGLGARARADEAEGRHARDARRRRVDGAAWPCARFNDTPPTEHDSGRAAHRAAAPCRRAATHARSRAARPARSARPRGSRASSPCSPRRTTRVAAGVAPRRRSRCRARSRPRRSRPHLPCGAEDDPLPYLPEPLAVTVAARALRAPGHPADTRSSSIPLYPDGAKWPDARAVQDRAVREARRCCRTFDAGTRTLFASRCRRRNARGCASERQADEGRAQPAGRLELADRRARRPRSTQMSLNGQHWMLTPWRHVELVHAMQRPLDRARHREALDDRPRSAEHVRALPNFIATCSITSTEPSRPARALARADEDAGIAGRGREPRAQRRDAAFQVKITEPARLRGDGATTRRIGRAHPSPADVIGSTTSSHDSRQDPRVPRHAVPAHRVLTSTRRRSSASSCRRAPAPSWSATDRVPTRQEHQGRPDDAGRRGCRARRRRPAPEVLYVVPTFGWVRGKTTQGTLTSWRRGGGLRVYLDRPWNVTGYGEMLAVVLPSGELRRRSDDGAGDAAATRTTSRSGATIRSGSARSCPASRRSATNFPLARTAPDPDRRVAAAVCAADRKPTSRPARSR